MVSDEDRDVATKVVRARFIRRPGFDTPSEHGVWHVTEPDEIRFWDDPDFWGQDEPDCGDCEDTGNILVGYKRGTPRYGRCPCGCGPNRFWRLWWRLTDPILTVLRGGRR